MNAQTVGVVGLGLIGGSLAKALQAYTTHRVLGYDLHDATMRAALDGHVIDGPLDEASLGTCEVLLLAVYPADVRRFVLEHLRLLRKDTLIVDCAGVKREVCAALSQAAADAGVHFIGGHPMAGIEKSGLTNAFPELFRGAAMILCTDEHTDPAALAAAKELFLSLGFGRITLTSAEDHDHMIAYTSQLAHIVSSAYVRSEASGRHLGYSANSFKDLTRVARLDEVMWTELFFENRDYLLAEAEGVAERLQEYITALRDGDHERMRGLLRAGTLAKEASESGEGR